MKYRKLLAFYGQKHAKSDNLLSKLESTEQFCKKNTTSPLTHTRTGLLKQHP